MSPVKLASLIAGVFFLLIIGISGTETISAGHRGVVTHLGAVQDEILGEGFHFVTPLITTVYEISVRIHKDDFNASAASKDLQTVNSVLAVNWHLKASKVNKIYQEIGDREDMVVDILSPAVSEVFKATAAKYSAEEILTRRAELKEEVDQALRLRLAPFGVEMDALSLVDISFGQEFTKAIESKQVAEQEAQKAVYEAQRAEQEAQKEINLAKGRAESQKLRDHTLTSKIILASAVEKWDGKFPLVMGGGALPFLDLNKLESRVKAEDKK